MAVLGVLAALGFSLLWVVRDVLTPFIVAVVLAYILRPIVTGLCQRTRLPRPLAAAGVLLVLVVLVTTALVLLAPAIGREARGLAGALPRLIVSVRATLAAQATVSIMGFQVDLIPLADELTRALVGGARELSLHILEAAVQTVETVLKSVLSLIIAYYLLVDFGRFRRLVRRALPPSAREEIGAVVAEVDRVLGQFLRAEVALVLIMSTVTWISLTVLGIRYAAVLGIAAGVLELIPFIGPIMAATPAVILALFLPSPFGWPPLVNAAVVAATYFVLRHAEDYFVIPQLVGRAVELHPLVAMFAAFSGLRLGGNLGMLLAIPVAAVLRILLVYVYRKLVPQWDEPDETAEVAKPAGAAGPTGKALPDQSAI